MRRTFTKIGISAVYILLTIGLLSACGTKSIVGTWYLDKAEGSFFNFEKDGIFSGYNSETDFIYYGSWTKNDESYVVTGLSDHDLTLELTDEDDLYCYEYVFTLTKGVTKETPKITAKELKSDTWITVDGRYELEFYETEWDLFDNDKNAYLKEGTYMIEDGNIKMETIDGVPYQGEIAKNRHEITVFDDMVFIIEE